MSVPYTDSEASEARQWSNRHGPPNAWTASFGTAARMIGRLLDERERLMAKQTVAEYRAWVAQNAAIVKASKEGLRDHFAAAALAGRFTDFAAFAIADAMLRERERTNHDAAPAARAESPDERPPHAVSASGGTPSAASRDGSGTGDTPATHATHGEGSERRECTEPVAWGVANGKGLLATSISRIDAVDMQSDYACDTEIVPLYRSPTLTDAEAETLRELRDEAAQYADEIGLCASEVRVRQRIIDGLLVRLGGER